MLTQPHSNAVRFFAIAIALQVCASSAQAAAPTFKALGDLAGGSFASQAVDVSADGSVIVGWGTPASGRAVWGASGSWG